MENIFQYYTLGSLLADVRGDRRFTHKDIAKTVGITPQSVSAVFNGKERLVINHITGWKRAFKLRRLQGAYFELLAILAAYPYESGSRSKLHERAFHLMGRLEEAAEMDHEAMNGLIYWADPIASMLRNMVELNGFPKTDADVGPWVVERLSYMGTLGTSAAVMIPRIEKTWNWLRKLKIIKKSQKRGFIKQTPNFISPGKITAAIKDLHSAILALLFVDTCQDFAEEMGTDRIIGGKVATFALGKQFHPIVAEILDDFLRELVGKLNYVANRDDLERLKTEDEAYHAEVLAFMKQMKTKGYTLPEGTDADVDSVVQVIFSARSLTK